MSAEGQEFNSILPSNPKHTCAISGAARYRVSMQSTRSKCFAARRGESEKRQCVGLRNPCTGLFPPSATCNFTPSRWRRPWCGLRSQAVDRTRTLGRAAAAGGAQFIHRRSRGMRPLVLCAPAARLKLILTRRLSRASEVSIGSSPMLSTMRPACSGGSSSMW